jgi:hypothetical protein
MESLPESRFSSGLSKTGNAIFKRDFNGCVSPRYIDQEVAIEIADIMVEKWSAISAALRFTVPYFLCDHSSR